MSAEAANLGMNFDSAPAAPAAGAAAGPTANGAAPLGNNAVGLSPTAAPVGPFDADGEPIVYNTTHAFTQKMNELEAAKAKEFNDRRRVSRASREERDAKRSRCDSLEPVGPVGTNDDDAAVPIVNAADPVNAVDPVNVVEPPASPSTEFEPAFAVEDPAPEPVAEPVAEPVPEPVAEPEAEVSPPSRRTTRHSAPAVTINTLLQRMGRSLRSQS